MAPMLTRNQLVDTIYKHVKVGFVKRCIDNGDKIVLLGAFVPLTPSKYPGWAIQIVTRHNTWNVGLVVAPPQSFRAFLIKDVPWENWVGDNATHPLYIGDNPDEYRKFKSSAESKEC